MQKRYTRLFSALSVLLLGVSLLLPYSAVLAADYTQMSPGEKVKTHYLYAAMATCARDNKIKTSNILVDSETSNPSSWAADASGLFDVDVGFVVDPNGDGKLRCSEILPLALNTFGWTGGSGASSYTNALLSFGYDVYNIVDPSQRWPSPTDAPSGTRLMWGQADGNLGVSEVLAPIRAKLNSGSSVAALGSIELMFRDQATLLNQRPNACQLKKTDVLPTDLGPNRYREVQLIDTTNGVLSKKTWYFTADNAGDFSKEVVLGQKVNISKGDRATCDWIISDLQNQSSNVYQQVLEGRISIEDLTSDLQNVESGSVTGTAPDISQSACVANLTFTTDNVLGWFICPVVKGAHLAISELDNIINGLMTVDVSAIFDRSTSSGGSYYTVWSSFRNIALGIVVIAALIMLVSTALGFEILDAYTIKKTLPRVGLALLLIILSWPILEFLVTLINDIGNGIRALIYSPFKDSLGEYALGGGSKFILNLFSLGAFLALGLFGLAAFAGTALLAILVAFLVLVVREMMIVMLVILAPLGIVGLVLPNTQKLWQLWQNTLTTLLIAFPIIAALIAIGRVFSSVAYSTSLTTDGVPKIINELIAFIAYFAPYFMLPLAFSLAGGFMAKLAGIANNSERGAFDRLRKYREGKVAKNTAGLKTGTRFSEGGRIQRFTGVNLLKRSINRSGEAVTTPGVFPGKRREARDQKRRIATADFMKTPQFQAIKDDDDALMALTYGSASEATQALTRRFMGRGMSRAEASASASRAVNAAKASVGFGRPQAVAAAQAMVETGTAYQDLDDMTSTLARASGGNRSTAAALGGFANAIAKQKGRHDWSPGANNVIGDIEAHLTGGPMRDRDLQMQDAWESGSLYQVTNGKERATRNFVQHIERYRTSGNDEQRMQSAIALTELQHALPSASGANQRVIVEALENAGIDYRSATTVDEQIVAATRAAGITGTAADFREIQRKARIYDRDTDELQRRAGTP